MPTLVVPVRHDGNSANGWLLNEGAGLYDEWQFGEAGAIVTEVELIVATKRGGGTVVIHAFGYNPPNVPPNANEHLTITVEANKFTIGFAVPPNAIEAISQTQEAFEYDLFLAKEGAKQKTHYGQMPWRRKAGP